MIDGSPCRIAMNLSTIAAVSLLLASVVSPQQCTQGLPTTTGTVTVLPTACPGTHPPGSTCTVLRVDCAGLSSIECLVRVTASAPGVSLRGTVVLGTGGGGTGFYGDRPGGPDLVNTLAARGFRVVERSWARGWFSDDVSVRKQSCRYATLLEWIHANLHTTGVFCATGNSGGSAEICFALTTWNAGAILDVAVPTGGPPMSRLDFLCTNPPSPQWQQLCVQVVPPDVMECGQPACTLNQHQVCVACNPTPTAQDLHADSILHSAAVLAYPNTRVHQVLGARDCTSAVPNGLLFHEAVSSEKVLEFAPGTPHWTADTAAGRDAIVRALLGGVACVGTTGTLEVSAWPHLGGSLDLRVHGPAGAPFAIALGFATTMLEAPSIGWLFVAPPHILLGLGAIDATGQATVLWPFPSDPGLIGLELFDQAIAGSCVTNMTRAVVLP